MTLNCQSVNEQPRGADLQAAYRNGSKVPHTGHPVNSAQPINGDIRGQTRVRPRVRLVRVFVVDLAFVRAAFFAADQQAVERVDIGARRGDDCVGVSGLTRHDTAFFLHTD